MDNAARTRDLLNHNQMLYQLSYIHHVHVNGEPFRTTSDYYTRFFVFVCIGVLRIRVVHMSCVRYGADAAYMTGFSFII